MRARTINEIYKEESDPIHDMGIGQTLEQEWDEKELSPSELKEFDMDGDDPNVAEWSGILIHPMSGYDGGFEYMDISVTLTKEGPHKYVVTQSGERRHGSLSKREQRELEDGELQLDEWNIDDFKSHVTDKINDSEEFSTYEEAVEYIDSDGCLDFQG